MDWLILVFRGSLPMVNGLTIREMNALRWKENCVGRKLMPPQNFLVSRRPYASRHLMWITIYTGAKHPGNQMRRRWMASFILNWAKAKLPKSIPDMPGNCCAYWALMPWCVSCVLISETPLVKGSILTPFAAPRGLKTALCTPTTRWWMAWKRTLPWKGR